MGSDFYWTQTPSNWYYKFSEDPMGLILLFSKGYKVEGLMDCNNKQTYGKYPSCEYHFTPKELFR